MTSRKQQIRIYAYSSSMYHCLHDSTCKIAAIYSPPKHKIETKDYVTFFGSLRDGWIAGDEFNTKHHMWVHDSSQPKAINAVGASCLSNGEPMYWPIDSHKMPDCVDFFLSQRVSLGAYSNCKTLVTSRQIIHRQYLRSALSSSVKLPVRTLLVNSLTGMAFAKKCPYQSNDAS